VDVDWQSLHRIEQLYQQCRVGPVPGDVLAAQPSGRIRRDGVRQQRAGGDPAASRVIPSALRPKRGVVEATQSSGLSEKATPRSRPIRPAPR